MIVVCATLINPEDNDVITVGREYMVLQVSCNRYEKEDLDVQYTIVGNNSSTPLSFRAKDFEIVDNRIPSSWGMKYTKNHQLWIGPIRWMDESLWQDSFWEDYWADDEKAKKVFEEEVTIMSFFSRN
jgi:hypothetical protein